MSYRWFYTDVAAEGWTVVVIFMLSPVFSSRKRAAAVNVAAYRDGKSQQWAFSEYRTMTMGDTRLGIGGSSLYTSANEIRIQIAERSPFRRRPLNLELSLSRVAPSGPQLLLQPGHHWQALMPRAVASLSLDGTRYAGLGYHDTNWGDEPLRSRWSWTRAHEANRTSIHYAVKGHDTHLVTAGSALTQATTIPASPMRWRRTGWGLSIPETVSNGLSTGVLIESSPFYARMHGSDAHSDRLTEVAHFARFRSLPFRWMPYFRSRAEAT